jgi:plastocyanin
MAVHRQLSALSLVGVLVTVSCASQQPTPAAPGAATVAPTSAAATAGPVAGTEACAAGGLSLSSIQAPAPTVAPTATQAAPPAATTAAASPAAPPTATPTLRPAPTTDRVGFPEGYLTAYKFGYVYDRKDAKSVSYICLNDVAAAAKQGQPFPFGSVIVFESWRPKEDDKGNLILDAAGHMIRSTLNAIFVMRKEQGFGVDYKQFQTGDWEYIAYRPDKSFQTAPQGTGSCAACHQASNKERDWTMRAWELPFTTRRAEAPVPGPGEVSLNRMAFFPGTLSVAVGTTVKWTNSAVDKIDHTVNANDNSFSSGTLKPAASFSFTFAKAGTYAYFCSLHPEQMRATVVVK